MIHAPSHVEELRELERSAVLEASALLDSPAEQAFDRLTRLATQILNVPIALVSLVARDRQFFKSCIGLPEPWASRRETPLSLSVCKHVVACGEPLVVMDARVHPLLRGNLAILDLGVVAYLGVPLTTAQGHTLGSLCVIDSKPRDWSARDIEVLESLADLVMGKIQLRLLAQRFQADYLELRNLQLHRQEMLNMLVHDLRNPLSSFLGGLEMTCSAGALTERQAEYLGVARDGGEMLLQMVNGLLDAEKDSASAPELKLAEVSPAAVTTAACRQMAPLAEKSGVKLSCTGTAEPIEADADKLRRVLVNLIGNAVQHTPVGGVVNVTVSLASTGGAEFIVSDTGYGIPPEALETIFEKFAGSGGRRVSGSSTGLGLPFSRMVIEAHGGHIWVESEPDRGTSFHFTIPRAPKSPSPRVCASGEA